MSAGGCWSIQFYYTTIMCLKKDMDLKVVKNGLNGAYP